MKGRKECSILLTVACLASGPALAQDAPPPAQDPAASPGMLDSARGPLDIRFYENKDWGTVIRPVLRLAGGLNHQFRTNDGQPGEAQEFEDRITTTALLQFGLHGQIVEGLTFYSEFERNMGTYGTSVWFGTAAIQARRNYLRYEFHGASISAGIIFDPASADHISYHVMDMLGRDQNVAGPSYWSGVNLSQGILAQYRVFDGLTLGLSFSSANPLATSLSYGIGGKVADIGRLYWLPTKAISMGEPGSNAQLATISPGLVLQLDLSFMQLDFRTTLQYYFINVDTNTTTDQDLNGYNARAALKLSFLDGMLAAYVNVSYRINQMIVQAAPIDVSRLDAKSFIGKVFSGGLDFNIWKKNGIGVYYGMVKQEPGSNPSLTEHFLNIGATYWIIDDHLALGARYTKHITMTDGEAADAVLDSDSYFVTLRMLLD